MANPETNELIFIVDDDSSVRRSLTRLIRSAGRNVEAYGSAREFLDRLPHSGRSCMILDLTLPDISGLELCYQMAARGFSLPTIFITGGEDVTMRARATSDPAVDFVDFLTKPVDAATLLNAIRRALSRAVPK
jgi:FixJ family two-component response regulator